MNKEELKFKELEEVITPLHSVQELKANTLLITYKMVSAYNS